MIHTCLFGSASFFFTIHCACDYNTYLGMPWSHFDHLVGHRERFPSSTYMEGGQKVTNKLQVIIFSRYLFFFLFFFLLFLLAFTDVFG